MSPGSYRVHVFHERATEQTLEALTRTVEWETARSNSPRFQVSESGYLQVPHKNKYGRTIRRPTIRAYLGAKP